MLKSIVVADPTPIQCRFSTSFSFRQLTLVFWHLIVIRLASTLIDSMKHAFVVSFPFSSCSNEKFQTKNETHDRSAIDFGLYLQQKKRIRFFGKLTRQRKEKREENSACSSIHLISKARRQFETDSYKFKVIGKISGITEWCVKSERSVGNRLIPPLIR